MRNPNFVNLYSSKETSLLMQRGFFTYSILFLKDGADLEPVVTIDAKCCYLAGSEVDKLSIAREVKMEGRRPIVTDETYFTEIGT